MGASLEMRNWQAWKKVIYFVFSFNCKECIWSRDADILMVSNFFTSVLFYFNRIYSLNIKEKVSFSSLTISLCRF